LTRTGDIGKVSSTPRLKVAGNAEKQQNPSKNPQIMKRVLEALLSTTHDRKATLIIAQNMTVWINLLYADVLSKMIPDVVAPTNPPKRHVNPKIAISYESRP